jgi:hypothetical protein
MHWDDVRALHPDQWLVIEVLEAHSEDNRRSLDRFTVLELCADGGAAFQRYRELRRGQRSREFCFLHTSWEKLEFEERRQLSPRIYEDATRSPR